MVVKLFHEGIITNGEVVRYLNRCSDFIFILARVVEVRTGGSTLA
jgi:cob(I)alamin adenosyltransferase